MRPRLNKVSRAVVGCAHAAHYTPRPLTKTVAASQKRKPPVTGRLALTSL